MWSRQRHNSGGPPVDQRGSEETPSIDQGRRVESRGVGVKGLVPWGEYDGTTNNSEWGRFETRELFPLFKRVCRDLE